MRTAQASVPRNERSSLWLARLYAWLAHKLGRRVGRILLRPIVLYFLLFAPAARRAARDYLSRVLNRPAGWRDVYRQFFCFSAVMLDRVYLFAGGSGQLDIRIHGRQTLQPHKQAGRGVLIVTSHVGSFEVLRALGENWGKLRIKVLMDRSAGAKANAALQAIGASQTDVFIDTSASDVDRVLKMKAALDRGEFVCLMADRFREGERITRCQFLGDDAHLPTGPWLLAAMLDVPVFLGFGLYSGGNRYDVHFERFECPRPVVRREREAVACQTVQQYADRLAHYVERAPYNWANFYDFWNT